MNVARIYLRVSTEEQDLVRQSAIVDNAKAAGFYIAGIYEEKASGARSDRPELLRLIKDLQPGEVLVAEKMDRLSRLPLAEAEALIASIQAKGAKLAIPGVIDLSEIYDGADPNAQIVLKAVQDMLLKLALQMARDDYETRRDRQHQGIQIARKEGKYAGRKPDTNTHERIIALKSVGNTIKRTASLSGCSPAQVKRIWAIHKATLSEKSAE